MESFRQTLALFVLLSWAGTAALAQGVCDGISVTSNTNLDSVLVAGGLTLRPLFVTAPPGDTDRIFIVEQDGYIRVRHRGAAPNAWTTFLDIDAKVNSQSGDEMGLLGLAFDPDFATNGFFYVNYTEGGLLGPWASVVARYSVSSTNPDVADPNSEVRLMRYSQPQTNHNGGMLAFGPDGYLYIWTGDGGGANDQHGTCGNGQNLATVLGKILRIDPKGSSPGTPDCKGVTANNYSVPVDNPFRDGAGGNCDEVWAYGLRNPWRDSFDRATGDLYVADVGQNCWEEVNFVPAGAGAGANFAWRKMEGNHCFDPSNASNCNPPGVACGSTPPCNDPSFTDPIFEYCHSSATCPLTGCSITGGYVYRGCRMSAIQGKYFYGDYCRGFIRSFEVVGGTATNHQDWTPQLDPDGSLANGLTSFGEDAQGELYFTDRSGEVFKIVPPFSDLETSGRGAAFFLLNKAPQAWTWEDVHLTSEHTVSFYRVYRGTPNGSFECIQKTTSPEWPSGGDPAVPAEGVLFAYVVTAVNPAGAETRTGHPGSFNPATCP
jgi:hypothetical protein